MGVIKIHTFFPSERAAGRRQHRVGSEDVLGELLATGFRVVLGVDEPEEARQHGLDGRRDRRRRAPRRRGECFLFACCC